MLQNLQHLVITAPLPMLENLRTMNNASDPFDLRKVLVGACMTSQIGA
jgi:hypothetical protein